MKNKINIAMVGVGAWGANLLRNFVNLPDVNVKTCCDLDLSRLQLASEQHSSIKVTTNINAVLDDPDIDAVVVAVNTSSHFDVASLVLDANKSVYVEKPMCVSVEQAKALCDNAASKNLTLMVGHVFLYHPAVVKIKKLINDGELGQVHTIHSRRLNWGKVRSDENAMSSLAPHDISIMIYLFDDKPTEVISSGIAYLQERIEDTVMVSLKFPGNKMGFIHSSWIDPVKERKITVIGSNKTAVFDMMAKDSMLKIYQDGREVDSPTLLDMEPLALECQHFIDCVRNNKQPLSDGQNGLEVVSVLEVAQKALQRSYFINIMG